MKKFLKSARSALKYRMKLRQSNEIQAEVPDLMGSAHSLDPNSVMFSIVHEGQHIQADDRMWAGKLAERTTILRKD
jgi:hypothetical protein